MAPETKQYRELEDEGHAFREVEDEGHALDILSNVSDLRKEEHLFDVTLTSGNLRVPCHRIVLAGASKYFRALFTSRMREYGASEVQVSEVPPGVLSVVVDFVYTGRARITRANVQEVLVACNFLEVLRLRELCEDFLVDALSPATSVGYWAFAEFYSLSRLSRLARQAMLTDFKAVVREPEYLEMSADDLAAYIADDTLCVDSEDDVYRAVRAWIVHDFLARMGGDVWRLLQHVRFPFCSRGFFADVVEPDVLMTGPECAGYVAECRKYHATAAEERRPEVGPDDNKRLVPRDGMKAILVTGGFSNEGEVYGVWRYRHGLNACEPITTLPLRCAFISACAFATRLFVTGGQASSGQIVADTWSFCVRTQSWQRHARMCHARMLHSTAVVGGRLYAVGGQGNGSDVTQPADTRDNDVIPDDVELVSAEEYDADADEWRPLPDMLKAVKRPAVASFSGCLWVIGGSVDSMGVRSTDVVQVYDPTSGQWSYGTPLPEPLFCPGAVVVTGNRLYVYGGQRHTVYRYEPRQQLWRALAVASQGHMEGGCIYWQGKLLLLGGKSDAGRTDIVEAYDVHNDSWSRCECPLPKSLSSHTVALVKSC